MTMGLLYWILMLFWLLGVVWINYPFSDIRQGGHSLLLFVLLLLLGWAEFGAPIR